MHKSLLKIKTFSILQLMATSVVEIVVSHWTKKDIKVVRTLKVIPVKVKGTVSGKCGGGINGWLSTLSISLAICFERLK